MQTIRSSRGAVFVGRRAPAVYIPPTYTYTYTTQTIRSSRGAVIVGRRIAATYVPPTYKPANRSTVVARGVHAATFRPGYGSGTTFGAYLDAVEGYTDSAALAGTVPIAGSITAQDITDSASGSGSILVSGGINAFEGSSDAADVRQSSAYTPTRQQWVVGRGAVLDWRSPTSPAVAVSGALDAAEILPDSASLLGANTQLLAATDNYVDTSQVLGQVLVSGALAAADVYADTASLFGEGALPGIAGALSATDAYIDTAALNGGPAINGSVIAVEAYYDRALVGPLPRREVVRANSFIRTAVNLRSDIELEYV